MLFGGQILKPWQTPREWLERVQEMAYTAVYFPVDHTAPDEVIDQFHALCGQEGLVIAEVGAWSNPLSSDPAIAKASLTTCIQQLKLADRVGAACCVNISGSLSNRWDGPHPDQLSQAVFDRVVAVVQHIIDTAAPQNTDFTLELMPWMLPDSPESYLELIQAIDRPRFAVHLDPANIMCSPRACLDTAAVLNRCFDLLGPYIRSCHAKDIRLESQLTTHINEVIPGQGSLDYRVFLQRLIQLGRPVPLMMEHLSSHDDVAAAARYIRGVAATLELVL
ncbi:MAG: TIM barrel protein [Eubacteriales bacterium]|nr:TIM barrel protein [Eubacteriales bacterium]